MPTNFLRRRAAAAAPAGAPGPRSAPAYGALVSIHIGDVTIRVRLAPGRTGERLWAALPLFSTAEPWGDVVHFEIPVEIGRERGARVNAVAGEVYLWAEEDRILMPFGPTPISREGEIRLPRPCNVLGHALDDLAVLGGVKPGWKVSIVRGEA